MKKLLFLLLAGFITLTANAGPGDTIHVVPHTQTYINYYGDFYNWAVFPSTGTQYRKITLLYTLKCPGSGCSAYDYTQQLFIRRKGGVSSTPVNVEIGRVITPFGGGATGTWSRTYRIDVTDYASVLADSVEIGIHYEGYASGWLATMDFEMIEGTPAREAYKVENVWNGYFPYGYAWSGSGDTIEYYLAPKSIQIDNAAPRTVLRIVPTGHGGGGAQNCAEFCAKNYFLYLNNSQIATRQIWRDDCGLNPVYPGTGAQSQGTWLYDRANWCPGSDVTRYDHDLSSLTTPGSSYTLNLDMEPGIAGSNTGYHFQTQLISYKAMAHTLDASVEDIVSPSAFDEYKRFNPICGKPEIVIRNTGSTTLTSLVITYGAEGGVSQTYNWTGSLAPLESAHVFLDPVSLTTTAAQKYFTVSIGSPNGAADQYSLNNTMRCKFATVPEYDNRFLVNIRTNQYVENSYEIADAAGNIVYSKFLGSPNTSYMDTVDLPGGCYTFRLDDINKDGLSYPFYGNNGYFRFKMLNGNSPWINFPSNFGTSYTHNFTTRSATGIRETWEAEQLQVFPNPGSGVFITDIQLAGKKNAELIITDLLGRVVYSKSLENISSATVTIDISKEQQGVYQLIMQTPTSRISRKIVIMKD